MSSAQQQVPHLVVDDTQLIAKRLEATVVAHSPLFYWWPVWILGFLFGLYTYWGGVQGWADSNGARLVVEQTINGKLQFFPSNNTLGVVFCVATLLVVLITNVELRGWASIVVVGSVMFITLFFAYMRWWDDILQWLGNLDIFMNSGFYFVFSSILFVLWAAAFFVFDRLDYWVVHPGQTVHKFLIGAGERTYDTHGISVYKMRNDLFRHWILGLGSGDLHISVTGAEKKEFVLPNVLFVGSKMNKIQELVAMRPDEIRDMKSPGTPD